MLLVQVGMNADDLPAALRFYAALGFANAGAQPIWGETMRVQGLGTDARAIMWRVIGPQPLFQLELFMHSRPAQRPQRPDWSPTDLGWVRCGYVVERIDVVLAQTGLVPLGAVSGPPGARRLAVRDPHVGCVVELMEQDAAPPWAHRAAPALVYVAASVSDLDAAQAFYETIAPDAKRLPLEALHAPADEALWGLAGRNRRGLVLRIGEIALELVRYASPGRPRAADYRCSDQGIVNVAFATRDRDELDRVFERLASLGLTPPHRLDDEALSGGYIVEPEREVELLSFGPEMDAALGFVADAPFFCPP